MFAVRRIAAALTQSLRETGDLPRYECLSCGRDYLLEYFSCPHCGSFSVERTRWVID